MIVFQTDTSKKKPMYHVLRDHNERVYHSICNSGSYWVGGYHKDKPIERPKLVTFEQEYADKLCPSCVLQAYKSNLITISVEEEKK